jgi:hypothetical protein
VFFLLSKLQLSLAISVIDIFAKQSPEKGQNFVSTDTPFYFQPVTEESNLKPK